jgi:NAD(P)-dependent dehydrogenase (short-subunit alcohol dehydrogenase family)
VTRLTSVIQRLCDEPELLAQLSEEQRLALMRAAGRLSRPDRDALKIRSRAAYRIDRQAERAADRQARAATGLREARKSAVFSAPLKIESSTANGAQPERHLKFARNCYVCKAEFTHLHFFYDSMCPSCADYNYRKRFQTARLDGRVAVITGARLKIGYHATLMMLRAGATVVASTRFPVDAALRFSRESDYPQWRERLKIYGLDLRHTPSVELFCRYLERSLGRLDILINNAAQTVRRPPGFYQHMLGNEARPYAEQPEAVRYLLRDHHECLRQMAVIGNANGGGGAAMPMTWQGISASSLGPGIGLRASAELSQIPYAIDQSLAVEEVFPRGQLDVDLQQVDLRETNSWRLRIAEVSTPEMLEVQLVNSVAPFVLCSRLTPLMRRDFTGQKHIVNVTAMEGKFYRFTKPDRHPHTNMAKAALNMLTHTSAGELEKDGIYMNAVDTGWVTDEDPAAMVSRKQEDHDFQPPLDIVDGAARICDPFFDGILSSKHWCGKFLKDYFPIDW